jgi:uncharacterized protein YjlB
MPIVEDIKGTLEQITGYGRPDARHLKSLTRLRKPHLYRFKDDGETPNNPRLPLIVYRTPLKLPDGFDPAAVFEDLFARNGWGGSWRNGIYDFLHFHTKTHEVLGIARGSVRVEFGGSRGRIFDLKTGDVAVLPAGTGHRRRRASADLLVVGAYPATGKYDQPQPSDVDHERAVAAIRRVALPRADPVYGGQGPLKRLWRKPS